MSGEEWIYPRFGSSSADKFERKDDGAESFHGQPAEDHDVGSVIDEINVISENKT